MLNEAIIMGFASALMGTVYATVLPDHGWFPKWYELLAAWVTEGGWKKWIARPLGGCVLCCSGQLGLWASLYFSRWSLSPDGWFAHFTSAAMAIISAHFIDKLWSR